MVMLSIMREEREGENEERSNQDHSTRSAGGGIYIYIYIQDFTGSLRFAVTILVAWRQRRALRPPLRSLGNEGNGRCGSEGF